MSTIVFGPWFGEFGWEITRWNPACRHLATTKYKNDHKIMIAPKGHKVIYDFVDEYIDIEDTERVPNMFGAIFKDPAKEVHYNKLAKQLSNKIVPASLVAANEKFKRKPERLMGTLANKIKKLAKGKKILVIFPRQRALNAIRNWSVENWRKLAKHYADNGYYVFAFGGIEDHPLNLIHDNYTDFLGYNGVDQLDLCISALNLAECGIAIQSGGIHLSMYACDKTAAFGLKSYYKRHRCLTGDDYPSSKYQYIAYDAKNWSMPLRYVVNNIEKLLQT